MMGLNGTILKVNLSERETEIYECAEAFYRTYIGGPGIGLYYLLKKVPANCDPLSPDNVLVFAPGLLTGTAAPCAPRFTVCAKSPLTNALGKSEAGGFWGPELKKAGFDAVIVEGKADSPVYILIVDGKVEIRDASKIWDAETGETEEYIFMDTGMKNLEVACIGPGGTNCVRFAGIASGLSHFNGRNGLGAVMGSKNLKAIAVCGSRRVEVSDKEKIKQIAQWVNQNYRNHPLSFALHEKGTPIGIESSNASGCLPTYNWSQSVFSGAESIGAEALEKYLVKRDGCYSCPIKCKRVVEIDRPDLKVERRYGGPEYETLAALGSNCGIRNLELIIKANEMCNRYTLDTISTGMVISFAMACYSRGLLTKEDTGGLELEFGNEEVILPLIEQIAYRRGFGKMLADGTRRFAAQVGQEVKNFLLEVKGQEVPMHDPRVKAGMSLQYALAPQGADHWFAQHDPFFTSRESLGLTAVAPLGILEPISATDIGPDKVRLILYTSFLNFMYDCLGVCVFGAVARSLIPINYFVELTQAVTGWETSLWELMKVGERINTMARLFNVRQGFKAEDDKLPKLFFQLISGGPLDGKGGIDEKTFRDAVQLYYEMAGWDRATGIPTNGKLLELGLKEFCC